MLAEEYNELSEISLKELDNLKNLGDSILIGGWAAHFLSNERFREWKNIDYMGSKDIDFGIKGENLAEISNKLEKKGYLPINFRFYKIFDRESKKEISENESKKNPIHKNFYLYVDLILDKPSKTKTIFFSDEIIRFSFENKLWIEKNGFKVIKPELLLLTKLRVLENRNEEKRLKDILDCLFISNFSNLKIDFFRQLREKFSIENKNIKIAKRGLQSNLLDMELSSLRFNPNEITGIKTALLSLLR